MRPAVVCVLSVALAGCDAVVSTERLRTTVDTRAVSCTHASFCLTCMPGFQFGKAGACGFKFSPFCPGVRTAEVNVTPVRLTRESGRVDMREEIIVRTYKGECH